MRKLKLNGVLAICCASIMLGCQPSGDASAQRTVQPEKNHIHISPNDSREYGTVRLDNGLNVVVVSDPDAEKAAAALNVHVGSMQNPDSQLGLAHYLEHMLFLGTEKYPDPDDYSEFMSRHGGMHNAYTADDHTNYMFQINNDRLGEALDRFSDFFKSPIFDPEYSDKELNAIDSEWSMRRASDGFILFKLNNILLNPEHPIARFRIGNLESLGDKDDSILYDEMLAFYERYYSANLMTATIIGNYSVDALQEKARTYFSDIPNHDASVPSIDVPVVTENERNLQIFYKPQMEMRVLQIDFTIDKNIDAFAYKPNELVAYMINSEMPGTPGAFLREQEWADNLGAYAQPNAYGNGGRFIIQAELTESGLENRELIAGMLLNYLDMLREQGIGEAYFAELETVLSNDFQFLQRSSAFNYATQLAAAMQHYPLAHIVDYGYRLDSFKPSEVERVLSQLTPDNARVWFMSQQEEVDQSMHFFDGEYRVAALNPDIVGEWQAEAGDIEVQLPSVNTLLPEDLSVHPVEGWGAPMQVVDEAGVSAWLQRSERFMEPRAHVTALLYQDTEALNIQQRMAAQVAIEAFNLSEQALAREASIAGVNFSLSFQQGLSLTLSGFNDKHSVLAERVLDGFKSYQPSQSRLEQVKDRLRRNLENQARQFPVQQLSPTFNSLMYVPGATPQARLDALTTVTMSDVIAARDALFEDVRLRMLVVGNYREDDVSVLTQTMAEKIKIDSTLRYSPRTVLQPRHGEVLSLSRDVDLEDVALLDAFLFADESLTARAKASLLAELMQSRFFNELRTEKQLGYAVGVSALSAGDYAGIGFLIQSSVAPLVELEQHFESFREGFVKHLAEMDDEAFAEAKQGVLVSLREQPQNLGQEAARIRGDWARENYSFDSRSRLMDTIERLSKAQMQAFYEELRNTDSHMRVLIQLRGTKYADSDFIEVDGATHIKDIADFQSSWLENF